MPTIRRILCPVDFSEFSRHALDHAVAVAGRYGAEITALHVIPPLVSVIPSLAAPLSTPMVYSPDDLRRFKVATSQFVEESGAGARVDTVVLEGNVSSEIVDFAESLPADLVVMATHGRSGFDRLMLGSVTERVLRKAACPVLTVPPRAPDAPPAGAILFRQILCGIDFSPSSMKALDYAVSLAREMGAALTLIHVLEPMPVLEPVMMGGPGSAADAPTIEQASRSRLRDALSTHVGGGVQASQTVTAGKPYVQILRAAEEQRADLIVIGVHGGAAGLLAFGSTTNHVVRQATCPVLSLKA
jgi:nucleotide-binding universal stress UspA family protein